MVPYPITWIQLVWLALITLASAWALWRISPTRRWKAATGVILFAVGAFLLNYAAFWLIFFPVWMLIQQGPLSSAGVAFMLFLGALPLLVAAPLLWIGWRLLSPVWENLGMPPRTLAR